MGTAAYQIAVKYSGTSTAFSSEATTSLGSGKYQITDSAKRCLDRGVAPTVYDGVTVLTEGTDYTVDYLFGIFDLTAYGAPGGAVTADGNYLPLSNLLGAKDIQWRLSGDVLDDTDFDSNGGSHTKKIGLIDCSASISRWYPIANTFWTLLQGRTEVVLEMIPTPSGSEIWRGVFSVEDSSLAGGVDALEEETLSFQMKSVGAGKDLSILEP